MTLGHPLFPEIFIHSHKRVQVTIIVSGSQFTALSFLCVCALSTWTLARYYASWLKSKHLGMILVSLLMYVISHLTEDAFRLIYDVFGLRIRAIYSRIWSGVKCQWVKYEVIYVYVYCGMYASAKANPQWSLLCHV